MNSFYLIRHAHTNWTQSEQCPLSAKGREDARRIAGMLEKFPITALFSSPFQRAQETVAPLATRLNLPILIEPDLRERKLGDGRITADFSAAVQWTWQNPTCAYPGGEANSAAQRRGVAIVQRLLEQYPQSHLVLSTHGNLLALVLQHYDPQIDFVFWKSLTMPDVYRLSLSRGNTPVISRLWQE